MKRSQLLFSSAALGLLGAPLLTQLVAAAKAASPGDIQMLNAGIELERAGIKAYDDAAASGLITDPHIAAAAGMFRQDHIAHRDALIAAVKAGGGTPSDATAKIPYPPLHTQSDVVAFAESVEKTAASTYLSVISEFEDRDLAQVAASILGVETTHVALLGAALNQYGVYPGGFVK